MKQILLVIDLQPAFAVEPNYGKIIQYIKEHKTEYDMVIATRFINHKDSPFVKKLGFDIAMAREKLEFPYDILLGKPTYGCGEGLCNKTLKGNQVTVIGCDTDACILATCFEMFQYGVDFHVLADYCYSSGGDDYHKSALAFIERNFGPDSVVEEGDAE